MLFQPAPANPFLKGVFNMAFEVFKPGSTMIQRLGPEKVSLSRGRMNVPAELLDRVGITSEAVVMGDRETMRIAVGPLGELPDDGEDE